LEQPADRPAKKGTFGRPPATILQRMRPDPSCRRGARPVSGPQTSGRTSVACLCEFLHKAVGASPPTLLAHQVIDPRSPALLTIRPEGVLYY